MTFRLPRLPSNQQVTDPQGLPTLTFSSWWQSVVTAIETAFNNILAAFQAATAAQGSADAAAAAASSAQTSADAATTVANGAQATANSALANAATAQATADSKLDPATAAATYAPINSPVLTGDPKAPTPTAGDNDTSIATTAFVTTAVAAETTRATTAEGLLAPKASPSFTGTPTAPTAAGGTNTTQLATTAFVASATSGLFATPGAWTSYTPTVSALSGTITTSSATGRWQRIGKTVLVQVEVSITTNGTGATAVSVSLPATSVSDNMIAGRERNGTTGKMLVGQISTSSTTMNVFNYDGTYPAANNTILNLGGVYEGT